ncbi:glycosyltransferase family 9 protein [Neptunicella marina]|uniref:Glycosyltransferase family 9 protein n=1 Tax=Neptunicella marina TaxID=2125989 RepID=A0A8J6IRE2_9ALTE|nr:hypothetical protein [Neptunicella marina]MBC3765034.1 hypothetical protein [Neptunicella marina]
MSHNNILLIRMTDFADVVGVALPALRYFKQQLPEANISLLSYANGIDFIKLAEPNINVWGLNREQWPDNIIPAMETFLGLAEQIVANKYDQIINLDCGFMPCFLARFLKDAGEPVVGNYISMSLNELLEQFQQQTLKPEYVNQPTEYMQSTFYGMTRWQSEWWQSPFLPDNGYPEFYLRSCCGFDQATMDWSINIESDAALNSQNKKVVALATMDAMTGVGFPRTVELADQLQQKGFEVWQFDPNAHAPADVLAKLKSTDLLVCIPGAARWMAACVSCPVMLISGDVDPRTFMPEFATDMDSFDITPQQLVESIESIFAEPS